MDRLVVALDELWSAWLAELGNVSGEQWAWPTPCEDWDVRQLAAHVAGGQSLFEEGFEQPDPPPGWTTDKLGVDAAAAEGVAARGAWSPAQIIDELAMATKAQVDRLGRLDEEGWTLPERWPPGDPTVRGMAKNRLLDGYIHLLDLRTALGRPLDIEAEPTAFGECLQQAFDLSGWGAVKRAGITQDGRIRLDLSGPGARTLDLVIEARRGRLETPIGDPDATIAGSTAAFLFVATARKDWIAEVGGLSISGRLGQALVDGYVIWD